MTVKIIPNDTNTPPGKLADAELHFSEGALEGLKLVGFAVWERTSRGTDPTQHTANRRNVTFPARQYSVNAERRSFALLRPIADVGASNRVREIILEAYAQYEEVGSLEQGNEYDAQAGARVEGSHGR